MAKLIRIGNQTAFSANATLDPWHYAIEQNFDAFEWFSDRKYSDDGSGAGWDETLLTEQQCEEIKQLGVSHDIAYSIHAPWQANPLHPDGTPLLRRSIDFAYRIGAQIVNLHLYMEAGAQGYVEALLPMIEYARDKQVRLSIENTTLTSPDDFNETFSCFHQLGIGGDQVGMCLDIGHANLCSATQHDYIRFIDLLDAELPIIHLHVHENWGDSDNHLALFTGPAGQNDTGVRMFVQRMEKRGFTGAMILEQWPQPAEILVNARDRLRAMISPVKESKQPRQASKKKQIRLLKKKEEPEPALNLKLSVDLQQQPLLQQIVQAHEQLSSWRQRLEWVRDQVMAETFQASPEQLIGFIVYLRFLATGEISCQEDGRHFRPNHHARAAMELEDVLRNLTTAKNAWLVRRLYPWLPSYDDAYRRREPLTRIRDIAHRNDIPKDLKSEIKHRLQNKLHRCAGPEDLVTSRDILQRITAPGVNYSDGFVSEFKIFHRELEEFFNATALDQRLADLDLATNTKLAEAISHFTQLKSKAAANDEDVLLLLRQLTLLRQLLVGMQQDTEGAQAQRLRMSDIALEDFAFSQFSDAINRLEKTSWGPNWQNPLELSVLVLENIALSCIEQDEARVLINEINTWRKQFDSENAFELLRLSASLQRALRLCQSYADQMLALFPPAVTSLGNALGVAQHAIDMFCESDIRANLIFQLSRLVECIQIKLDSALNFSPWETVVPGIAVGQLLRVKNLQNIEQTTNPVVVWLEHAEGDENIPDQVCGLILNHALPHLSHLAVRARQLRIPFAVARRATSNSELEHLIGQSVRIEVKADELMLKPHSAVSQSASIMQSKTTAINVPSAELSQKAELLKLEQSTLTNSGGKVAGAKSLLQLAESSGQLFEVPFAIALPFGFIQAAMQSRPALNKQYQSLLQAIEKTPTEKLDPLLEKMRAIVFDIKIPEKLIEAIKQSFADDSVLAVRSSSNCEDLEDFSGAGLHDSVLGVEPDQIAHAIKQVWASLWNRRAVLARMQSSVSQHEAHMAILIQTMIRPEWSFIMHTSNPYTDGEGQAASTMIAEIAMGLGETLASANEPGSPYRLSYNLATKEFKLLSMANYTFSLSGKPTGGLVKKRLDYSFLDFSTTERPLETIAKQLAAIANYLEQQLGKAQDVEGCFNNGTIYIVQTRAQQGL